MAASGVINCIEKLLSFLPRERYSKGIVVLIGGTALGQGILILFLPILTRLYQPQDMGRLGLFTSFINLAVVGVSLRYEISSVSAKNNSFAVMLMSLSFLIAIFTTILLTAVLAGLIRFNQFGYGVFPLLTTCVIAFLCLLLTAVFQIVRYFLLREDNYNLLARANVFQNAMRVGTQVGLGFFKLGYIGLILGDLLGRAAGLMKMLNRALPNILQFYKDITVKNIIAAAKQNKEYPYYSLPSAIVDTLAFSLSIPLLTQKFGIAQAGLYALVNRVLALPISLIGNSAADVFHGQSAACFNEEPEKIKALFFTAAKKIFWLGLGPMVLIALSSPILFGFIFGAKWNEAGILATILVPWTFAQLIVSPLSRIIFVVGGQAKKFFYDAVAIAFVIISIYGGSFLGFTFVETIAVLSILGTVSFIFYFFILYHLINKAMLAQLKVK